MSVLTLIIDAVLLIGIVSTSLYGGTHLPAGARIPTHLGPGGYGNWQPKGFALLTYPLIGTGIFVYLAVTARSHEHSGNTGLPIGLTIALAVILASQIGALRAALGNSGRENPGPTG
jgi:hypothetical protein